MKPIVDGLEQKYGDRVAFQRLNVNLAEGKATLEYYRLRGHPSYVILDNDGKMRWTAVGQLPVDILTLQLDKVLE
ncbi:MAG: hypothetical protein IT330_00300 [Anaerolineae bacterium]|nr:hypothetical protein [Anaerolineae bacterium]